MNSIEYNCLTYNTHFESDFVFSQIMLEFRSVRMGHFHAIPVSFIPAAEN